MLAAAWIAHALLARTNPRWRVLAWRLAGVALVVTPVIALWGPAVSLAVAPPERPIAEVIATTASTEQAPAHENVPRPGGDFVRQAPSLRTNLETIPLPAETFPELLENWKCAQAQHSLDWITVFLSIWMAGIVVGMAGELIAGWRLRKLRRHSRSVDEEIASCAIQQVAEGLVAASQRIRGLHHQMSSALPAFMPGVSRPVILLPEADCLPAQH